LCMYFMLGEKAQRIQNNVIFLDCMSWLGLGPHPLTQVGCKAIGKLGPTSSFS